MLSKVCNLVFLLFLLNLAMARDRILLLQSQKHTELLDALLQDSAFLRNFPTAASESTWFRYPENSASNVPAGRGVRQLSEQKFCAFHPRKRLLGFLFSFTLSFLLACKGQSSHLFLPLVSFWQIATLISHSANSVPKVGNLSRCELLPFQLSSRLTYLHCNGIKLYSNKGRCHSR